jgi:hypothetical protein
MSLGTVRYLLVIEGVADQWVTDSSLVKDTLTDKRIRHEGLIMDGAVISEKIDLREPSVDVSALSLRIRSHDDVAMKCFAQHRKPITWLTNDADEDDTTFTVAKGTNAAANDYVHIGTEVVKVTAVGSTSMTVTRQQWDTQQQYHYANKGNNIYDPYIYMAYDASADVYYPPPTLENRRAYLFRYLTGDTSDENNVFDFSSTKDGSVRDSSDTMIYRGVISQSPMLDSDGVTWIIEISSMIALLEQDISYEEVFGIRGIYHHDFNALAIRVTDWNASPQGGSYQLVGFWETNTELQDELNQYYAGYGTNVDSSEFGINQNTGELVTRMKADATPPDCICDIISSMEGCTPDNDIIIYKEPSNPGQTAIKYWNAVANAYYYRYASATGGKDWFSFPGKWTVLGAGARSWLGKVVSDNWYKITVNGKVDGTNVAPGTYPDNRIYVQTEMDTYVAVNDAVRIVTPGWGWDYVGVITAATTDANGYYYLELERLPYTNDPEDITDNIYPLNTNTNIYTIKGYSRNTDVSSFLDSVIDEAIKANMGNTPFITGADINTTDIALTVGIAAGGDEFLLFRDYIFGETTSMLDIMKEECKLCGMFMCLDSTGRITTKELTMPSKTDGALTTINSDNIVTPYDGAGNWAGWMPDREGIVNTIEIKYNYNPVTAEHETLQEYIDHDSIAIYKNRGRNKMEIAPYSSHSTDMRRSDIRRSTKKIAQKHLDFFAKPYDIVEIPVTLDLMSSVLCGTKVSVTCPHIPDTANGTRGITSKPGLCIGREWPLDATSAEGKLTIRIDNGELDGGYAPACYISAATNVSGNIWDLTVTENKYSPSGEDDNSYFSAGYKIKLIEHDASSPSTQVGSVSTVPNATTVRVSLGGAAPWGATFTGPYYLVFDALANSPTSDQQDYVYIAESDGDLTGGDDSQGSRFQ